MENLSKSVLPANMGYEWSGLSLEELSAGNQTYLIFGLGVLCLFLILAAQYESLVAPFIILFSVPLAVLGALAFNFVRGLPNDIFTQIGLVMLIGLSSKNGILIVEFANQLRRQGLSPKEAVIKAAQTRLRPILMTSFAFIFGLLPLLFSTGAGALARHSLGTAVIGGMLISTVLNLFVIPVFYVLFVRSKMNGDDEPVTGPSFEEGDFSVSDVFEDEPPQPDDNGRKAGLINYMNEEEKEPEIAELKDEPAKDDKSGDGPSSDETKNE
jgi:HAE1 family hydrophobic/amphiphilic exporter-1